MLHNKLVLITLILCSFSLLLTLAFNPSLQKSYFSVKPDSPFSHEFPQTRNGGIAHYFESSDASKYNSRFMLFNLTSYDAYPVLENIATACQIATPNFQPIYYHIQTDTFVYYCAANASLLIIDQEKFTVQTAIPFNLQGTWPTARVAGDGMSVNILAMDSLFTVNPKASVLVKIDMQSRQIVSQILFNQNLTSGEAVVQYAPGSKTSYIATNIWQNNSLITKIYTIITIGNTYQIFPVVNFISSNKTITKLYAMGNYIVVNVGTTLYFLNNLGMTVQSATFRTKELTAGVFHPGFVRSTDGSSLYLHEDTFKIQRYTIVASGIFVKDLGTFQDMQLAHANQASNDLMFTYDISGVFFKILDLQTLSVVYTAISSYNDLMLTNTTYTVVQTLNKTDTSFYIFDLKTDYPLMQVHSGSTKYYYNKDQQTITYLSIFQASFCQVLHLDLATMKLCPSFNISSEDTCSSYVSYARLTEKGNPELVIPGNQSYLIFSEAYGQIGFNTSSPAPDAESFNINFDDLSLYYLTANQAANQINATSYTFNRQLQSFELKDLNSLNRSVKSNGFFIINQNLTVALSDLSLSVINGINSLYYLNYKNNFNLVTSFGDQSGAFYMFFSYLSPDSQYSQVGNLLIFDNEGHFVPIPYTTANTVSGQATGPRSYTLYDQISSNVGVVRFFNSDPQQDYQTLISM